MIKRWILELTNCFLFFSLFSNPNKTQNGDKLEHKQFFLVQNITFLRQQSQFRT